MNDLVIASTTTSPEIAVHTNGNYALYHWLRGQSQQPQPDPEILESVNLMRRAVSARALHGVWQDWESAIVLDDDACASRIRFRQAVATTGDLVVTAMEKAEPWYRSTIWPNHLVRIEDALTTIRAHLVPVFATIATGHARLLNCAWPARIDATLIVDGYELAGGYSHPLTIDVAHHTEISLCETLLHETTHVADVYSREIGQFSLGAHIMDALVENGMPHRRAFDRWHTMIFAASAWQIRQHIDPDHIDYASARDLYAILGVPDAVTIWQKYAEHGQDRESLIRSLQS